MCILGGSDFHHDFLYNAVWARCAGSEDDLNEILLGKKTGGILHFFLMVVKMVQAVILDFSSVFDVVGWELLLEQFDQMTGVRAVVATDYNGEVCCVFEQTERC